jgi:hypothetical protein
MNFSGDGRRSLGAGEKIFIFFKKLVLDRVSFGGEFALISSLASGGVAHL